MDQDSVDRAELLDLAAQLASPSLIKHKDRAVRILTACALANILRLFAPEAPYSADQLEVRNLVDSCCLLFRECSCCSCIN